MKKAYLYWTGLVLLVLNLNLQAQNPNSKAAYSLGHSQQLLKQPKNQSSTNARQASSAVTLNVSAGKAFKGKVNYRQSIAADAEYVVGEIENTPASSFFIKIAGQSVEGNIILKDSKQAFQYTADKQGNAYIQEVDINKVLCIDYTKPSAAAPKKENATAAISAAVADLQSFPGARGCLLLDYDGHYVSGTPWNNGNPINAAPSGMSDAAIQESWEIVSEDFRPFSINVTTNEAVFNSYPKTMRMRCIITPTNTAAPGAGGVAYIGSFNWNDDTPCWVFMLGGKSSAEAASHEFGHTFGLGHDGRTNPNEGYFAGHGDWAPIMGVGYYESISQWSRGEYSYANNTEDDLAKISSTTYNVGYRNDDHSNATAGATALARNAANVSGSGIIERTGDLDFFSVASGAGTINLTVNTVSRHGNLDILVRLYNSAGAVIGTYNAAGLNTSFSANVSAGTYYVSVDGTGAGNPATDGYSDYGSLGQFFISGTVPTTTSGTGVATFYRDVNYGGTAVALPVGSYNLAALQSRGILNDDISSLRVSSGYRVTLYADDNFTGATLVKTGDDASLVDDGWNDRASSLVISTNSTFSTTIQAENYNTMAGVQTETTTDAGGGLNVGWIETNDWMSYHNINIPTSGAYLVEYRVASGASGGTLSLDLNGGATVLGTLAVPATGGWQTWTTISHTVNITTGTYNFGIFASVGGWNINWFRVTKQGTARVAQAIEEISVTEGLVLYPNPANNKISIQSSQNLKGSEFGVVDATGKTVAKGSLQEKSLDVSALKAGIYMLVITTPYNQKLMRRFVKQ